MGRAGGLRRRLPVLTVAGIGIALAALVLLVLAEVGAGAISTGLPALILLLGLLLAVIAQRERSHRLAIEALSRAEERLPHTQTQLTGVVAHDLNNLLGVIIGNLDLLLESPEGDPEARELAEAARDAALRCVVPIAPGANDQPALPLRPRSRLPPSGDR
ncbi:MAG TPA: histidine kinase dimerization/phospho-acceptor domain-containing protein [Stellaceae bacterium]|nr:histidine kinase dimerization/phospho-acceptor domain-containing protein [Stellaceae bacterium]